MKIPDASYLVEGCTYGTVYRDFKPVTRYTRAGKNGKTLYCSNCYHSVHVYHFSWDALVCAECERRNEHNPKATDSDCEISKFSWLLQTPER